MFTEEQLDEAEGRVFPCHGIDRNRDYLRTISYLATKTEWNSRDIAYMSQFILDSSTHDPSKNYGPYLDVLLKGTPCWNAYREWRLSRLHKREIDKAMRHYCRAEQVVTLMITIGFTVVGIAIGVGTGNVISYMMK